MASSPEQRHNSVSIILMCLGNFLFWGAMYVYVPILSLYAQHLGASMSLVGVVVGAYGLTQLLLRIPVGVLSDRSGRRKPFVVAGFAAGALGCLGLALSPNAWFLALFRAVLGVGCTAWVTATVLFVSYFPTRRATQAMAIITFVGTSAQLVVSLTGGKLAQEFGWQAPFFAGAAMAALGTLCVAGVRDVRAPGPGLPPLRQLRRVALAPGIISICLSGALLQYATFSTIYGFTPIYAENLSASKTQVGLLLAATLAPYAVFSLAGAPLSARVGEKCTLALGLGTLALAILFTPLVHTLSLLALLQLACGAGRGLVFPTLMALVIRGVRPRDQATAMGMFQAVYAVGMFGGPILGGIVADAVGLAGVFLSSGAVSLLAVGLAVVAIAPQRSPGPNGKLAYGQATINPDRK